MNNVKKIINTIKSIITNIHKVTTINWINNLDSRNDIHEVEIDKTERKRYQ